MLKELGIDSLIDGALPQEEKTRALFIKAIRHGSAKNIKATIGEGFLEIVNDGLSQNKVQYGNGLNRIKIEAEQLGYSLNVESKNPFQVSLRRLSFLRESL